MKMMIGLQTSSSAPKSGSVILTQKSRSVILTLIKRLEAVSTLPALLVAMLLLLSLPLFSQTLAEQGFENSANDTWAYTANPASTVPYFWGRTNQTMGGATAQNGNWYWASWLIEANEVSMTFANIALTPGTQHSLNFYYYSRNLNPATDQLKICLEYDNGTEWNNWMQLLLNTGAWSLFSMNIPEDASTVRVKILTQYTNTNIDKYAHWDSFSIKAEEAEHTAPIIYNTSVAQRIDGSKLVDISYDLFDANGDLCEVALKLSSDGGATFTHIPNSANLSGDIGENISPGTGKNIVWDTNAEGIDFDGDQYMIQFFVDDGQYPMPENFVFVEGGTFNNGTSDVTLSSFYIDKYELTQAEYQAVMGVNPSSFGGYPNRPVEQVSWFDAIEYCNRRSMQEGLTPCYSYSTYGTDPNDWPTGWNTSYANHTNVSCDWTANGYRLPTEMEWMFAAKGGNQSQGYTYSGSNTIGDVAWHGSNSGSRTHDVGELAANELGTFDMSGNVWEWVWDIYGFYPSGSQNNPTGANSGSDRVIRGGGWGSSAGYCTVSYRGFDFATGSYSGLGIRVVRVFP
jgi:formylglycine-generating enzyme